MLAGYLSSHVGLPYAELEFNVDRPDIGKPWIQII